MHYHSGVDYFTPAAGSKESMTCEACLDQMEVQRDVMEIRGKFGNVMPEKYHRLTDIFTCRHAGQPWHDQLIALMREAERTPSKKLEDLLQTEIDEIRKIRVNTKKHNIWW